MYALVKCVKEGEWISVDGTTGEVFLGKDRSHHVRNLKNKQTCLIPWVGG